MPMLTSSRAPGAAATKYRKALERASSAAPGRPMFRVIHSASAASGSIDTLHSPGASSTSAPSERGVRPKARAS